VFQRVGQPLVDLGGWPGEAVLERHCQAGANRSTTCWASPMRARAFPSCPRMRACRSTRCALRACCAAVSSRLRAARKLPAERRCAAAARRSAAASASASAAVNAVAARSRLASASSYVIERRPTARRNCGNPDLRLLPVGWAAAHGSAAQVMSSAVREHPANYGVFASSQPLQLR